MVKPDPYIVKCYSQIFPTIFKDKSDYIMEVINDDLSMLISSAAVISR